MLLLRHQLGSEPFATCSKSLTYHYAYADRWMNGLVGLFRSILQDFQEPQSTGESFLHIEKHRATESILCRDVIRQGAT
jgi:hypothetical protein